MIKASGEDYLETIYVLKKEKGRVRAIDIAKARQFSKASVSRAMTNLKQLGYIKIENSEIELTIKGSQVAQEVYAKHQMIMNFLVKIGVDETTASIDACRMEHYLSKQSFECIKKHLKV